MIRSQRCFDLDCYALETWHGYGPTQEKWFGIKVKL